MIFCRWARIASSFFRAVRSAASASASNCLSEEAFSAAFLGLRDANDKTIFQAAREANAVVMTKDSDFLDLQLKLGVPPQIILINLGNTSNQRMREVLHKQWLTIRGFLEIGEPVVEIQD